MLNPLLVGSPQAHESLTSGHFPAPEETLQHLGALRLQFLHGDKARVNWILENVYPMGRLRSRILHFTKAGAGATGQTGQTLERRRTSFLEGTLRRGLKTGSMKKQRMEEEQMLEMWIKEETSATRASILEKWSRIRGLDQHQAMLKYMTIIKEWPGYGSTLFDVEVKTRETRFDVESCRVCRGKKPVLLRVDLTGDCLCCLCSARREASLTICG